MVLCTASLAMADETLYCADTAVNGFDVDMSGKGTPRTFTRERYGVKVISETTRTIAPMEGPYAGKPITYKCHPSAIKDQIACNDIAQYDPSVVMNYDPWLFYKNSYARAHLMYLLGYPGPPFPQDPIAVAYGTCTRF
jgi:hypothetical protein